MWASNLAGGGTYIYKKRICHSNRNVMTSIFIGCIRGQKSSRVEGWKMSCIEQHCPDTWAEEAAPNTDKVLQVWDSQCTGVLP